MSAAKASTKSTNIIVLTGAEEFLVRERLDALLSEHVTDESRAFDFNELRSADVDGKTLWNALITLPLLAARRVIVFHVQSELKDDVVKALTQYVSQPAPTTLLIIVNSGEGMPPVKSEGGIDVISCDALRRTADRVRWARDYAGKRGKELSAEAAEYLVSTSQTRLSDIAAKLDHAILYVGNVQKITGQDLMKVAGVSSAYLPWDLEDAILERHPRRVFEIARSMQEGGEELLRLLAYQRGSLLKLWQIGHLTKSSRKGKSDPSGQDSPQNKISAILGKKVWKSKDFESAAAAIGETRLQHAVVDLLDLEVRLKQGRAGWSGYYEWVWRLLASQKTRGTSLNL